MDTSAGLQGEPRAVGRIRAGVASLRRNWYLNLLFVAVGVLGGKVVGDAYDHLKPWAARTDAYIADLQASQQAGFRAIQDNLQALRGSLPYEGRDDFRRLQASINALESQGDGLVQQLALAKQQNDDLRTQLAAKGGPTGGYDFTVSEDGSLRLDARTVLGVTSVGRNGVRVNLTTAGDDGVRGKYLASGESIAYRAADGRACKVTLLGAREAQTGAAAFALGCR
jgi:hypothetical protein